MDPHHNPLHRPLQKKQITPTLRRNSPVHLSRKKMAAGMEANAGSTTPREVSKWANPSTA
eukprot:11372955-Prorocentrum_lima.AAC.1